MGISRRGQRITQQMRNEVIQPGDILLLLVPKDQGEDIAIWLGALPLADRGLAVTQNRKTWTAIALFGGAVAAASLGLIYLPVALGLVVVGYVLTRIVPLNELYTHIEWPVVVLLGSMIPLGAALETAGGTQLIAGALVDVTEGLPAWAILTALMIVTMTLSDVLNNTATTIVAAPVGIQMAQTLNVSPDPFLMAVAVAASCAFLTPIGHKNNTLILGPGGYRFGDYWRMGLPLEIIVVVVSIPAILVFWPPAFLPLVGHTATANRERHLRLPDLIRCDRLQITVHHHHIAHLARDQLTLAALVKFNPGIADGVGFQRIHQGLRARIPWRAGVQRRDGALHGFHHADRHDGPIG